MAVLGAGNASTLLSQEAIHALQMSTLLGDVVHYSCACWVVSSTV